MTIHSIHFNCAATAQQGVSQNKTRCRRTQRLCGKYIFRKDSSSKNFKELESAMCHSYVANTTYPFSSLECMMKQRKQEIILK